MKTASGENEKETEKDEWWWIDFMENELDPSLQKDLVQLLQHSERDRWSLDNFRTVKQWLVDSDPIKGWPIEKRIERARAKVMAVVEKTAPDQDVLETGISNALRV